MDIYEKLTKIIETLRADFEKKYECLETRIFELEETVLTQDETIAKLKNKLSSSNTDFCFNCDETKVNQCVSCKKSSCRSCETLTELANNFEVCQNCYDYKRF